MRALRPVREWACALLRWRSAITYLSCLGGLYVYEYVPLGWLQLLVSDLVGRVLKSSGHLVVICGINLCVDGYWVYISKDCTYVELILVTTPLVLRRGRWFLNVLRLGGFIALVFCINIGRIALCLHLYATGVCWWLSHDLADWIAYGGTLGVAFVLWARVTVHAVRAELISQEQDEA